MSNNNDNPVRVAGEERRHPAIRKLARACIELALLRLAKRSQTTQPEPPVPPVAGKERRRRG
jgi:hypothetical protein